jgi:hypothetical protein
VHVFSHLSLVTVVASCGLATYVLGANKVPSFFGQRILGTFISPTITVNRI